MLRTVHGKKDGIENLIALFVATHTNISKAAVRRRIGQVAEKTKDKDGNGYREEGATGGTLPRGACVCAFVCVFCLFFCFCTTNSLSCYSCCSQRLRSSVLVISQRGRPRTEDPTQDGQPSSVSLLLSFKKNNNPKMFLNRIRGCICICAHIIFLKEYLQLQTLQEFACG